MLSLLMAVFWFAGDMEGVQLCALITDGCVLVCRRHGGSPALCSLVLRPVLQLFRRHHGHDKWTGIVLNSLSSHGKRELRYGSVATGFVCLC